MATTELSANSPVGKPQARIDGPLKVSGKATYTSDHNFEGMLYAVPVCATIANGRVANLDASAAQAMPGVRGVYWHGNAPKIFATSQGQGFSYLEEKRPPLSDDIVRYFGQYIAVVVADTLEQATAAADRVQVKYSAEQPNVDPHLTSLQAPTVESVRGDAEGAFASAPVTIDQTYGTPVETHNSIELHATVAVWDGSAYTLYETTQGVVNQQAVMLQMLGVQKENLRVISRYLGSGFGGKISPWPHSALAAVSARELKRPVKLVLTRQMTFQTTGHRPITLQRVRLGATKEGRLTSLRQDYLNHTSMLDSYKENCSEATPYLYSVPNLRVTSALTRRNVGTPTAMRGPGAVPGLFATESALDELAVQMKMDPIQLRILNEPKIDEGLEIPFSSRHIIECFTTGATEFGWSKRNPNIGSMRRDGLTVGWGVAGCSWIAERFPADASVELRQDGTVRVSCATQDIGTGTYTVLAQLVSDKTGVPLDRVEVILGDSSLPPGPLSGGSMVTGSLVPAVAQATDEAITNLLTTASTAPASPLHGKSASDLSFSGGRIFEKKQTGVGGVPYQAILTQANLHSAAGRGSSPGTFGGGKPKLSTHCYGAHFAEVTWEEEIARLRVSRVVSVIDAGRIINPKAAKNQIEGAVVMGIGMALFEETHYDPRNGQPINSNLADYVMATNADVPPIEVRFLDYPDYAVNELGAKGLGEIGLAGIAAAITNAVHHATGVRVRSLPVKVEELIRA